jgi:hypothetical protein
MRRLAPAAITGLALLSCGQAPQPAPPARPGPDPLPRPVAAGPAAVGGVPTFLYGTPDAAATREMRDSLAAYEARTKAR